MQREILFRGKRVDNGEWVEGFAATNDLGIWYIIEPVILTEVRTFMYHEVIPETVGQYTGLTDKHGKKIFEGDICARDYYHNNPPSKRPKKAFITEKLPVIFSFGEFKLDDYNIRLSDYGTTYNNWWDNCEIIGNIHTNPELINQK